MIESLKQNLINMNTSLDKTNKFKKYFLAYIIILLILGSFASGLFLGRSSIVQDNVTLQKVEQTILSKYSDRSPEVDFSLFWDVWNLIDEEYIYRPVDHEKMLYGAIQGALFTLDDPYTQFLDPDETKEFNNELHGNLEGIGAEVGIRNNVLTVISPLKDSPAATAGLKSKDVILEIDGTTTADLTLTESVSLLRGPQGTEVTVLVARKGEDEVKEITIERAAIDVKSVDYKMINVSDKDNNIAFIEITQFGDKTADEFSNAITEILAKNPSGIILDLRNNVGGYFKTAVSIADEFLPEDNIIAIESFSDGTKEDYISTGNMRINNIPVVILVNNGTASASEILSASLNENLGSKLIGEKTYGKGTVQIVENLKNDSSVRISIAEWLTPNGENIEGIGIEPDIIVELTEDDYNEDSDPQLDKALEIIFE